MTLKAKRDDGRIEVELGVDSNRAGQTWATRVTDNGVVVHSRQAPKQGRALSVWV